MTLVSSELMFDTRYFSETSYTSLAIIESCRLALDEGADDIRVIDTASSYTYSLVMEILENVKEKLLKLCSTVLSLLNNYILNNAKLVERYQEFLKSRLDKLNKPFTYVYFEYPDTKNYPIVLQSSSGIESDVKKLQDAIIEQSWASDKVYNAVDNMLSDFASKTIGEDIDPSTLKDSVRKAVSNKIKGKQITKNLTKDDINNFITEIKQYKPHLDDIKRTKKNIITDYELLKRAYKRAVQMPSEYKTIDRFQSIYDPDKAAFENHERARFFDINTQMTRMFNGFISIYDVAFDTKLKCLQERVELNRAIILELMITTGATAALNTKNTDRNGKPFKYEPVIRT